MTSYSLRDHMEDLALPVIAAPMYTVTGPALVQAACLAGIAGVLPALNAPDLDTFRRWLDTIQDARSNSATPPGLLAVNIPVTVEHKRARDIVNIATSRDVDVFVTVGGDPTRLTQTIHERGGKVIHDVTTIRFAQKAIDGGVDGLICVAAGGGGHSGSLNPFVLVPAVRKMFDGLIVLAGAVSTGTGIRAARMLGADLVSIGTPFIATRESLAPDAYKQMLVDAHATDLVFTAAITGIPANWLIRSLQSHGIDTDAPIHPRADYRHLPPTARPWRTLWSAGQSVQLIDEIPSVAVLVDRLAAEYNATFHAATDPRSVHR